MLLLVALLELVLLSSMPSYLDPKLKSSYTAIPMYSLGIRARAIGPSSDLKLIWGKAGVRHVELYLLPGRGAHLVGSLAILDTPLKFKIIMWLRLNCQAWCCPR